ncbi:PAS domain S-box-containing protein/diguanylate cyclase (GGDEF) domain-containing protein [Sphingobium faniae]|nr:PAS domain S-box-containing protein/diguanylate cyclase (GGDEF) domain-containing protein [Sphingobium faniae]
MRSSPRLLALCAPLLTGGVYFLVSSLSLMMSRFEGGIAFIWGANAFLMAELLTSPRAHWLRAIMACALASAVSTTLFGFGPVAAFPMMLLNIAESLGVAIICRHYASGRNIMVSLVPLAVFVAALCGVNALVGTGAALTASFFVSLPFSASWLQWWSGHVLGGLICAPVLVMLMQGEWARWFGAVSRRAKLETLGLLLLLGVTSWYIFSQDHYPLLFMPLLPLVMISFRAGHHGAAASIVVLAIIGGASAALSHGYLSTIAASPGAKTQFFQIYLAFSFFLSLPVAAELNGRRRLFQMLRDSEARYRIIAEHCGDMVLNLGVDGRIHYASPSVLEQIGCAPDLLMDQPAADLIHPKDRALMTATCRRALEQPQDIHRAEFRLFRAIDDLEWHEMVARAVIDEQDGPTGIVCTIRDMSRHKAQQQALQQAASQDSLTGAASRSAFLERLETEIGRVAGDNRSCLLLLDLDHFKAVNDCYGHAAGDRVLGAFVERLKPGLRSRDCIGRLGGEEFAILLADLDIHRASAVCERLRRMVAGEPVPLDTGQSVTVTFSAGLVELDGASEAGAMLEAADKALYRAKNSGRNCLRLAA